ncbi:hypothetical protein ACWF94_17165 [Streptomyces sp. NPDC055078]
MRRGIGASAGLLAVVPLAVVLVSCASPEPAGTADRLAKEGWAKEPILQGAESTLGEVSPAACRPLVTVLDRRDPSDEVTGFRHKERRSYLLIREFDGTAGLPKTVLDAAGACPAMKMGYDSTALAYTVGVVAREEHETRLLLTARESGNIVTQMLVSASEKDGKQRLTRVMRPEGVGDAERTGADLAV